MQILGLIFYFNSLLPFVLSNDDLFCIVPYARKPCHGPEYKTCYCQIDPLHHERTWKCDNRSFFQINLQSTNLLILYPPFIEIYLNEPGIANQLQMSFLVETNERIHDLDFRSLSQFPLSINFTVNVRTVSHPTQIVYRIYTWFQRSLLSYSENSHSGFIFKLHINPNNNSAKRNDSVCIHLMTNEPVADERIFFTANYTCPSEHCSTNENRLCLGLTPCLYMGDRTLLCQIDRLRSNDQFNSNVSLRYTNLIITTSDTHPQTLHTFSAHLLNSCIAERLIIIVIHGRLEIPLLNLTSFHCSGDLDMKVEFWHGHCSTFEILHTDDLERMYETNLITLGNFYTGRVDRLNITCSIYPSIPFVIKKSHLLDWVIVSLLSLVVCLICILGFYHGKNAGFL